MSTISGLISSGGGGLTPKFQEFTSSGTFTPSQALIDAGGYIEVFLVAGASSTIDFSRAGLGGEAFIKPMYLNSTSSISVTIGSGAAAGGNNSGSNSSFSGSSAGGIDLTAIGGGQSTSGNVYQDSQLGATWTGRDSSSAGNGIFGYGAGGTTGGGTGVLIPKPNSGQGAYASFAGGSGYCLVKWYE